MCVTATMRGPWACCHEWAPKILCSSVQQYVRLAVDRHREAHSRTYRTDLIISWEIVRLSINWYQRYIWFLVHDNLLLTSSTWINSTISREYHSYLFRCPLELLKDYAALSPWEILCQGSPGGDSAWWQSLRFKRKKFRFRPGHGRIDQTLRDKIRNKGVC